MKKLCPNDCEGIELQALIDQLKGGAELDAEQRLRTWLARALFLAGALAIAATIAVLFWQATGVTAGQPMEEAKGDLEVLAETPKASKQEGLARKGLTTLAEGPGKAGELDDKGPGEDHETGKALGRGTNPSQAVRHLRQEPGAPIPAADRENPPEFALADHPQKPKVAGQADAFGAKVDGVHGGATSRAAVVPESVDPGKIRRSNPVEKQPADASQPVATTLNTASPVDPASPADPASTVQDPPAENPGPSWPLLAAWIALALGLLFAAWKMCRRREEGSTAVAITSRDAQLATMNRPAGATRWATPRKAGTSAGRSSKKSSSVHRAEADLPGIRLRRTVGRGAQGVVWYGEIESTGEPVAIKLFNMQNRDSARALLREVSLCSRVNHPNILNIILSDWASSYFVLVMEWVDGENLSPDLFQADRDRLECVRQLANGIRALDDADIVHRDIKPANIMVRKGGLEPVIVDFGVAYDVRTRNLGQNSTSGTPFFMPPESFAEEALPTPAVDAYALGMLTLYLFGHLNLQEVNALPSLVEEKRNGSFANRLETLIARLPSQPLQELVAGLVDVEPARRLAAMADADRFIDQALAA